MNKIIAAINMTLDGILDHTAGVPDEEVHMHYAELLREAEVILYGRITYQLMQYWQTLVATPSGEKSMDDFALAIDGVPKIVFSSTLTNTGWDNATLSDKALEEKVMELKQAQIHGSKDIFIGSRSLIIQLLNRNLIDEIQLCIHPVVEGSGMPLFQNVSERTLLKLIKTKTFSGGAVILYYEPIKQ